MTPKRAVISDADAENITRVEELAYELRIEEVMTAGVSVLSPRMFMQEALEMFQRERISGAPVVLDDEVVGILSIEDLIRSLRQGRIGSRVDDFMSREVIFINSHDPVVQALKTFLSSGVGRLPVLDAQGKLAGILTKGDITNGLLNAVERDYHAEELIRYRASHLFEDINSDRTGLVLRYNIRKDDFLRGGEASSYIKRALLRLGASPQIARRCGIAAYEAEMNLIIHADAGGVLMAEIEPHKITMQATDTGPGIDDIEKALSPGYSTATDAVREMGFGAGMGLVNIEGSVDEMRLTSSKESGTNLTMVLDLRDAG